MSFSRYSVLCCVPHGILCVQTTSSVLVYGNLDGRRLINRKHSPLGLAQYALPIQDGNDRSRRRVERDDQPILGKGRVW